MFEKDRALGLLSRAVAELAEAKNKLDLIRKEDGSVENLKQKRNAVKKMLEDLESSLDEVREVVAAAVLEPPEEPEPVTPDTPTPEPDTPVDDPESPEPGGDDAAEPDPVVADDPIEPVPTPPPPDDLFSLEDQHAVSKLMQDSAVHLATIRRRNFWEIRHRNTADGRPSEAIRAATIAEAYAIYEQQAIRRGDFEPPEPRALSPEEQQALADFRNMPIDNPRSVRWETNMTEVDYIDRHNHHAGGKSDDVEFPPGELIGPIEHLKTVLS